jgi:hypothetical protein
MRGSRTVRNDVSIGPITSVAPEHFLSRGDSQNALLQSYESDISLRSVSRLVSVAIVFDTGSDIVSQQSKR